MRLSLLLPFLLAASTASANVTRADIDKVLKKPTLAGWRSLGLKKLGSGWQSDVWGNKDWVVKITKKQIVENGIMPLRDDAKRDAMTRHSLKVIEKLRKSPEFAKFKQVLPETYSPRESVQVQRRVRGLSYDQLSAKAKRVADKQFSEINDAAHRAAPGIEIDLHNHSRNVLYDRRGKISSFYDPAGIGSWAGSWKPGKPLGKP